MPPRRRRRGRARIDAPDDTSSTTAAVVAGVRPVHHQVALHVTDSSPCDPDGWGSLRGSTQLGMPSAPDPGTGEAGREEEPPPALLRWPEPWSSESRCSESSGARSCRRREAVAGEVRPDDHDDVKPGGVRHRCAQAQRLDRGHWHPELGGDEHRRLLLGRGIVDGRGRCRRRGVLRNRDVPALLLELLSEMAGGVGLLSPICDKDLHA